MNQFLSFLEYALKEFKEHNNICPNFIYQDFVEGMKEIPKANFPQVHKTIENFKNKYHSPFVNNFYYILLNLVNCPRCNKVMHAVIKDNFGVSSYIPLNGDIVDKVSSLLDRYMSKMIWSFLHI